MTSFPQIYPLRWDKCFMKISNTSLRIPKGESESLNRRTDNTMAKKQKDKQGSTKHYTENRANMNPTLNQGMNSDASEG